MAVNSFTIRIAGNIAYSDNFNEQYTKAWDSRFLATVGDELVFNQLGLNQATDMDAFLDALLPTIVDHVTTVAAGKTVSSWTMHISGNVAFDDNTLSLFDIEKQENGTVVDHTTTPAGASENDSQTAFANVVTDKLTDLNAVLTGYDLAIT